MALAVELFVFGVRDCETCSECLQFGRFLLGSRLLYFHLALTGICFRSVLRYFLKSEYGVGRDCAYNKSLWAGRSWSDRNLLGGQECDVTGMKLLSMSKYPQRGERIIKCLSCQGN